MRKLILFLALLTACKTLSLTEKGAKVNYYTKQEPPANCKQLPATINSKYNYDQIIMTNTMRNDVAEAGGNFLVIDTIVLTQKPSVGDMIHTEYEGTGRGFVCPDK